MIRMEVTKNGTLETLARCELTHEEVGTLFNCVHLIYTYNIL